MNIKNCKNCGTLYLSKDKSLFCENCEKEDKEIFFKIRTYLRNHENDEINVSEISKALNISTEIIMRYLREGKIQTR